MGGLMRTPLIAGNWKMNASLASNAVLLAGVSGGATSVRAELAVCVPSPYLAQVQSVLAETGVRWGAQDMSAHEQGAYTGEVSACMLLEFGCSYVIVGHSERRSYHAENDLQVAQKAALAIQTGLTPIVCVGETLQQREQGLTDEVVSTQLGVVLEALGEHAGRIVVAYEPVWAIGTGLTASPDQAQQVHAVLRAQLRAASAHAERVPIVYGGSMGAANAADLLAQPDVDGGLIGGAALRVTEFLSLLTTASC